MTNRKNLTLFLSLSLLIIFSSLLSSFTLINNVFSSPFMYEEKDTYIFARQWLKTGDVIYRDQYTELNDFFEYPIAALTYSSWNKEIRASVPVRPIGNYFFLAISILVFNNNFHFIYILVFILSGIFFGYLTSEVILNLKTKTSLEYKKIMFLASSVYLTFFPFILWANTWYDCIPGLFFFILALYFISKYVTAPKLVYIIFSALLLGTSFLFRYEYLLFASSLLITVYLLKRDRDMIFCTFIVILMFILTLLSLNEHLYGSPFSFGYSQKNHVVSIFNADLLFEASKLEKNPMEKILYVYLADFTSPNADFMLANINNFLIKPFLLYLFLCFFGIISLFTILKSRTRVLFLFPLLLPILIWGYYIFTGNFLGVNNPTWITNCYFRYSFPFFVFLLIVATIGILNLNEKFKNNRHKAQIISLLFAFIFIQNVSVLFLSDYGLKEITNEKKEYCEINDKIRNLTESNALIWAPFYEKGIVDRYVISPWYIIEQKERRIELVMNYTYMLLKRGYPIYYISAPWHRSTYLELDQKYANDPRFKLIEIDSGERYKIYKVMLN